MIKVKVKMFKTPKEKNAMFRLCLVGGYTFLSMFLSMSMPVLAEESPTVTVVKNEDGSVSVSAEKYSVSITPQGLLNLQVENKNVLEGGFGEWPKRVWSLWDGAEQPTVNVIANIVAIRSGEKRIEYSFKPSGIDIESEGFPLLYTYNETMVVATVGQKGKGGPLKPGTWHPNTMGLILNNGQMIAFSEPFHIAPPKSPRVEPSAYPSGVLKRGDKFQAQLKFQSVSMSTGLGGLLVEGVETGYGDLANDGSVGYGMMHFPDASKVALEMTQSNSGAQNSNPILWQLVLKDHYFEGKVLHQETQEYVLKAGETKTLQWNVPSLKPGFYYATITARMDGQELTHTDQILTVDLPSYRPPLTRPDDFKAFWAEKMKDLRSRPFNETLTALVEENTDTHQVYRLEMDGPEGQRLSGTLKVPIKEGTYIGSMIPWRPGVSLDIAWPESATFKTWESRDQNNLLECILINRRCLDYLLSRSDVDRLFLFGGSRGGPINWVSAALDPKGIIGLSIHVPTSFGCSWMDKKYTGWGGKPSAMSWAEYTDMAAYVDPVNHAPDMIVPFINAYGSRDPLAQPPGIEAAYQWSPATWKRMSRDDGGHTRTTGFRLLQKQFAELLQTASPMQKDLKILKDH